MEDGSVVITGGYEIEVFRNWNLLLKTAEILGQILKNYYGSLERPLKAELLREVFDGPLRLLRHFIEETASEPEALGKAIKAAIEKAYPDAVDKDISVRELVFGFVHFLSLGIVMQTGYFVASKELRDDIADVVNGNGSVAYRLIQAASRLICPGRLPLDEIRRLAISLKPNALGFAVLQALGYLHLQLFHVPLADTRELCSHLGISLPQVLLTRPRPVPKAASEPIQEKDGRESPPAEGPASD